MKKKIIIFLLMLVLISGTACTKQQDSEKTAGAKETIQFSTEIEAWREAANLNAEETSTQLYRKALDEETLIIYSNSTRIMDVKESFEKQYPGLTVYVEDIRSVDLVEKLSGNISAGAALCDIVFCDDNGQLSQELLPKGAIFSYVPYDMKKNIPLTESQELLPVVIELQQAFYNSRLYQSPPIHNWWELTEEKYRNKVVMPSPFKSIASKGFFSMILKNSEVMEKSYHNLYGKAVPKLPDETAGQAFWRLMFENGLILVNSSDEVYEMVGAPSQSDPPIGIMISSKIRMKSLGYEIQPIFDMDGFSGVFSSNNIMLAGGCKNINSAKLFIRWILGESDGQGEGYKPYLQDGTWSARTDVQSQSDKQLNQIEYLNLDTKYIYDNQEGINEFIKTLISNRSEEKNPLE